MRESLKCLNILILIVECFIKEFLVFIGLSTILLEEVGRCISWVIIIGEWLLVGLHRLIIVE